jgi:cytoskeletal protein RodZ
MDPEEERLRAALHKAAPEVDETGVMESVVRKGRLAKRRRRLYRGLTTVIVVAFVAFVGYGAFRIMQEVQTLPSQVESPSQPTPATIGDAVTSSTAGDAAATSTTATGTASTTAATRTSVATASTAASTSASDATLSTSQPPAPVVYMNAEYGFNFTLPDSWRGYSIVTLQWEGFPNNSNATGSGDNPVYGPEIIIGNPASTAADPHQDIPIMIFTLAQWSDVQGAQLTVGAAPIPPTELGRNGTYVFALPARYNYAFPTGYKEVEKILEGNPLRGIDSSSPGVDRSSPTTAQ